MSDESRTREQVAELVMAIFDRLETGVFAGMPVLDAVLLVEVDINDEDTVVLMECTSTRATVQLGMLQFAVNHGVDTDEIDEDD